MDKLQQVKAKLEEMKAKYNFERENEDNPNHSDGWGMFYSGFFTCLKEISFFLDTLEVKEVSSENPDEQMIARYLYEKKGYPIDLNGNIPSFEETMKDVEKYNKYKEDKFIEKACNWLKENKDHPFIGCEDCCLSGFLTDEFVEEFRKAMKEE